MISLKTQNTPMIALYLILNTSILILFYKTNILNLNSFMEILLTISKKDGVFFILLPIIIFVLSGIIPVRWKELFVFLKTKNRLPGCQAFSKYAKEDDRIDINLLKEKYGRLPKRSSDQNALWYNIYKNIKNEKSIIKANKDYLLARELAVMAILLMPISILVLLEFSQINEGYLVLYELFLLFEYLIFRTIAKNHAERLVTNVLACESSRIHEDKYKSR